MTRRHAAVPALIAVTLSLAACGGSSAPPSAVSSRPTTLYTVSMTGAAETPKGAPHGRGVAIIAFHRASTVCFRFSHLHGFLDATVAHIHSGTTSHLGPVLVALFEWTKAASPRLPRDQPNGQPRDLEAAKRLLRQRSQPPISWRGSPCPTLSRRLATVKHPRVGDGTSPPPAPATLAFMRQRKAACNAAESAACASALVHATERISASGPRRSALGGDDEGQAGADRGALCLGEGRPVPVDRDIRIARVAATGLRTPYMRRRRAQRIGAPPG
jgi:CHRD domain